MSTYRLLRHKHYDNAARRLPTNIRRKATWAQVLLGMRGRTPSVKGTSGLDLRWRRTPVQGNHYYMWWIPQSESGLPQNENTTSQQPSILIHSIRHHDQTDAPIHLGSLTDYEEVVVSDLDPRFDEQKQVSHYLDESDLSLSTIKGLPGSGKTVSLLYLVKDLIRKVDQGHILYVTYTNRLKRSAREFLAAQDEQLAKRVHIHTLNELLNDFTGIPITAEPFSTLKDFHHFLAQQNNATLGPWKKYPQTLYTEIRAHLLGQAMPPGYTLPETHKNGHRFEPGFSAETYATNRGVAFESAELAYRLATRATSLRYFREQDAAKRALSMLVEGQLPSWLGALDALVIDEIQDLTLLQIAFLGELVRQRTRLRIHQNMDGVFSSRPFVFTVAGDESQIVQPSGFDWGMTKDLLSGQLDVWPEEFEFQHQRRAPQLLAQLIDNSWNFYRHLPKAHRPSAQRQTYVDEAMAADYRHESGGHIFLCQDLSPQIESKRFSNAQRPLYGPVAANWADLIDEIIEKPGRVIIDVTETLRNIFSSTLQAQSDDVLFLPREIKGLERATVIVYGLNEVYERALDLSEDPMGENIPRFEARRLFDEMRVALSRSTHTLVLLEPPGASVLAELGLSETDSCDEAYTVQCINIDDLIDLLRTEEMSELEVIEGHLDEVDDLLERERWTHAYHRNRRAYVLARQLGDVALQREAQSQYIQGNISEAASLFYTETWEEAHARNQQAYDLAIEFSDPLLIDRVEEQAQAFGSVMGERAGELLSQANSWAEHKSFQIAHRDIHDARSLAVMSHDSALQERIDGALATICREWAFQLTETGATEKASDQAATLLDELAGIIHAAGDIDGARHPRSWRGAIALFLRSAN